MESIWEESRGDAAHVYEMMNRLVVLTEFSEELTQRVWQLDWDIDDDFLHTLDRATRKLVSYGVSEDDIPSIFARIKEVIVLFHNTLLENLDRDGYDNQIVLRHLKKYYTSSFYTYVQDSGIEISDSDQIVRKILERLKSKARGADYTNTKKACCDLCQWQKQYFDALDGNLPNLQAPDWLTEKFIAEARAYAYRMTKWTSKPTITDAWELHRRYNHTGKPNTGKRTRIDWESSTTP